jgi:hypothetical protein
MGMFSLILEVYLSRGRLKLHDLYSGLFLNQFYPASGTCEKLNLTNIRRRPLLFKIQFNIRLIV